MGGMGGGWLLFSHSLFNEHTPTRMSAAAARVEDACGRWGTAREQPGNSQGTAKEEGQVSFLRLNKANDSQYFRRQSTRNPAEMDANNRSKRTCSSARLYGPRRPMPPVRVHCFVSQGVGDPFARHCCRMSTKPACRPLIQHSRAIRLRWAAPFSLVVHWHYVCPRPSSYSYSQSYRRGGSSTGSAPVGRYIIY